MRNLLLLVLLVLPACDRKSPEPAAPTTIPKTATVAPAPEPMQKPTAAGDLHDRLGNDIDFYRKKGEETNSWIQLERVANAHMNRARLTGNIEEYLLAKKAIDDAFGMAVEGAGPFVTRAHYHYMIHEIGKVDADIANAEKKLLKKDHELAEIAAMRGDLAFHRADLDGARQHYTESLAIDETASTVGRLALLDLKTGNYDAARKGYEKSAELSKREPYSHSWALLHRGIVELETDNVADALTWYEKADAAFSGWYLVEEHIAEAKLLLGDPDAAIALYESILARTPSGEFMAAMAESYAAKGDEAKEKEWLDKARAAFERDIAKLPSAASGHALEFYLDHDHKRALELAKSNFELRPNHESRLLLAQAHLANGSQKEAEEVLRPVADSAWATPGFLATVAVVFDGQPAGAKAAEKVGAEAVAEMRARFSEEG